MDKKTSLEALNLTQNILELLELETCAKCQEKVRKMVAIVKENKLPRLKSELAILPL